MHQKCAEECSLEVSTDEKCDDGNCELQALTDYVDALLHLVDKLTR